MKFRPHMEQCIDRNVFLVRQPIFMAIFRGLFLLEVRILPAAREPREACVPPHHHHPTLPGVN